MLDGLYPATPRQCEAQPSIRSPRSRPRRASTSASPARSCSPPRARRASPGRGRSRCTSRASSPASRCLRSAASSAGAITRPSCTPGAAPLRGSPRGSRLCEAVDNLRDTAAARYASHGRVRSADRDSLTDFHTPSTDDTARPSCSPAHTSAAQLTYSTALTDYYPPSELHPVKLSLSTADLLTQLQTVTRVASTRSAVQALSGVMLSPSADSTRRAAGDRHGDRPARAARGRGRHARRGRAASPTVARRRPRAARAERLTLELRAAEQDVELICGAATFHLRTLRTEDFPTLPAPGARRAPDAADRRVSCRPSRRSHARPRAMRRARC